MIVRPGRGAAGAALESGVPDDPQPGAQSDGEDGGRQARPLLWIVPAALGVSVIIAASFGPADPISARLLTLFSVWLGSGWAPALYLLGAAGWGFVARPWTRGVPGGAAINAGVGLAMTLGVSHVLGVLGWLNTLTAWVWTGVGLGALLLAADRLIRVILARRRDGRWIGLRPEAAWAAALGSVGAGVLLVASASPPGALWDSEFGGYDSLSYHLQLPAQWIESGRIEPLTHNVYSYLPGYYEAGVVHVALMMGATARTPEGLSGLLAGQGGALLSSHLLAAGMTLFAAWGVFALTGVLAGRFGAGAAAARLGSWAAAGLVLVTPWTQVVGSLAYNEPGVLALGAAGLAAAYASGITPLRRGVLVAILIGGAAGCKPTAVLFLGPAAAVLMAMTTAPRSWMLMFGVGAAVGLASLSPWMARNAAHGGNPVFPHAAGLFGTAHWDADQAERYAQGHRFEGGLGERLSMLALPAADLGAPAVVRWRGLTNPQWGLTPWAGLAGMGLLIAMGRGRPVGVGLLVGVGGGLVAWLAFTHLQSRFLVPLGLLFAAGFGAGVARLGGLWDPILARAGAVAVLTLGGLWSLANFAGQRGGDPNGLLVFGPGVYSGQLALEGLGDEVATAGVNEMLPPGDGLLLVGDATPLYLRRPVGYATVWDRHPLGEAMRADPGDPAAWTRTLRSEGYRWALVSFAELGRLERSGWNDPLLSSQRVADWTDTLGQPVRVWPAQGRALYRLGRGGGGLP